MSRTARVRIEAPDLYGQHARVFYVAADGSETEISDCVSAATFRLEVGSPNRATLDVICASGDITALLEEPTS